VGKYIVEETVDPQKIKTLSRKKSKGSAKAINHRLKKKTEKDSNTRSKEK